MPLSSHELGRALPDAALALLPSPLQFPPLATPPRHLWPAPCRPLPPGEPNHADKGVRQMYGRASGKCTEKTRLTLYATAYPIRNGLPYTQRLTLYATAYPTGNGLPYTQWLTLYTMAVFVKETQWCVYKRPNLLCTCRPRRPLSFYRFLLTASFSEEPRLLSSPCHRRALLFFDSFPLSCDCLPSQQEIACRTQ